MTVGTAIVISIGIICVTFFATICVGAVLAKKKSDAAVNLTNEITNRLKHNTSK